MNVERLRSFMFLPAYNNKFIEKAVAGVADAIILDLEDSVPSAKRPEARQNIIDSCKNGKFKEKPTFVRVNEINTKDFVDDISAVIMPEIAGIMPSKVETADDIIYVDKLITFMEIKNDIPVGTIKLAPLIETTKAIENISEIAKASKRLVALCFGGEDYLNDLGSIYIYREEAFVVPRALIINAARSNHLFPIDTPYIDVHDTEGFRKRAEQAFKNGFAGNLVLSPRQVEVANESFYPDQESIKKSDRIMEYLGLPENKEKNIFMLEDTMIGPPMIKRAKNIRDQVNNEG